MIEKRWVHWIWVGDGCSPSCPLVLSVVLDFILKFVPFYLKCLKCARLRHLLYRLNEFGSSRRKIGKRQPERLQKEGKVTAWLRMVSLIVAALLTPFFTSKNNTLNLFFWFFLWTQSSRSQQILLRRPCNFHPEEKFKHVWTEHVGMAEDIRLQISPYFVSSFWRN